MEGLARDVGTGTGGQKDHRPGKVLRYLDPAERDVFFELEKQRTVVGMHRGVHGARSDGVHSNVLRSYCRAESKCPPFILPGRYYMLKSAEVVPPKPKSR